MSLKRKKLYQTQGTGEDINSNNNTQAFGDNAAFDTQGLSSWEIYQYYKNRDASWNTPDSISNLTPKDESYNRIARQDEYNNLLAEGNFDLSKSFSDPEMAKNYVAMTEDGEFNYTPKYVGGTIPFIGLIN